MQPRTKLWAARATAAGALAIGLATLNIHALTDTHQMTRIVVSPAGSGDVLFDSPSAHADLPRGGTSPGVQAAADHLIALQCPNGGWNWPHGGCSDTFANLDGPIGLGLLRAYEVLGDPAVLDAAIAAADHNLTNVYPIGGEERYSSFQSYFFYRLTQISGDTTYSNAAATQFFDELDAGTYGDPDYDTAGWIAAVESARSGVWLNLRPWEFSTIAYTADQIGNAGQRDAFRDAILDGLNALDSTDPNAHYVDILGLSGGVRGLALINETTFAPLAADGTDPDVEGIDNLCDLADLLVSYQNSDGSWYWHSNLASPTESDKDGQTTAYAVLALLAAQDAGCGPYDTAINKARAWLDSMQDVDGGFFSYPGGSHNIEVDAEILEAWAAPAMSLTSTSCESGSTLTVSIDIDDMGTLIVGGQFFLSYDNALLDFVSADPGGGAFTMEVYEDVDEGGGTIDYAVGVPFGGTGDMGPATMATLTFNVLGEDCAAELVSWRAHTPPSRLTDMFGTAVLPTLLDLPEVRLDQTPPTITCPADVMVDADAGGCDAIVDICSSTTETFDDPVVLASSQTPGAWYPDRYPPFGFSTAVFDGDNRLKHSIDASDCTPCRSGSFNSAFYDTQGRKFDTPGTTKMSIDVYIPSSWATTGRRMAGLWATAFDSAAAVSGFPFIEFTSLDSDPRFRFFTQDTDQNPDNGFSAGWIDMGLPTGFVYDDWYTLTIELVGGDYIATVGDLTLVDTITFGSVELGNVILQGHNNTTGVTYDIYWDNFTTGICASADDNCEVDTLTAMRSDALPLTDPYPTGTTTITWTATDTCGNSTSCTQDIVVSGDNEAIVDLAYDGPLDASVERCIEFVFDGNDGPTTVEQVVLFDASGTAAGVSVLTPCGDYDCLTVRDPLHTLASSVSLAISGTQYIASATGVDAMIGGNLNGDIYVDILDFGVFVGQFGMTLPVDTDCTTAAPHSDITGDGLVGSGDFSFIQTNFLEVSDSGCTSLVYGGAQVPAHLSHGRPAAGPVQRISVQQLRRRGLDHLIVADLNNDQWLDQHDIAAFLQGARP